MKIFWIILCIPFLIGLAYILGAIAISLGLVKDTAREAEILSASKRRKRSKSAKSSKTSRRTKSSRSSKTSRRSKPSKPPRASPPEVSPLAIRVHKKNRTFEGVKIPTLSVKIKGQMPGPIYGSASVEFFFHLFDSEKYEDFQPRVLSSFEMFQEEASPVFQYRVGPRESSGAYFFEKWTELFAVPIHCLGFPRKGRRKLKMRMAAFLADHTVERTMFLFGNLAQGGDVPCAFSETTFTHEVTEPGWLDENKNRSKVRALTIELALHMAAADGSLDKIEEKVVREWSEKIVLMAPEDQTAETKKELNAARKKSREKAAGGKTSTGPLCKTLAELATEHQKYDALKLCVEVMAADGEADDSELKELDRVVTLLGLDPDQYRKMLDPHLAKMPAVSVDLAGADKKALFGIRNRMSKAAIRKILTDANRKWNSRVTSSEPEIRQRAEEMLRLVAELRDELLG